jgi:hypothetical protein
MRNGQRGRHIVVVQKQIIQQHGAENAAICWLSESKRTEAMPLPVNTKDCSGTALEVRIKALRHRTQFRPVDIKGGGRPLRVRNQSRGSGQPGARKSKSLQICGKDASVKLTVAGSIRLA